MTLATLVLPLLVLTACSDDDQEPMADHTLLLYIVGDNNLSPTALTNLASAKEGLKVATHPLNLVVYLDNYNSPSSDGLPRLLRMVRQDEKVRTDTLYTWPSDHNSASAEVLAEVVRMTFDRYPSQVKGLILWSHGMSWLPDKNFVAPTASQRSSRRNPQLQYFGEDGGSKMELWDMGRGLAAGHHLDYVMFDACNMMTAEVAYEMSGCCDYLLGSTAEIMGDGFPYAAMMQSLSQAPNQQSVEDALRLAFNDYRTRYASHGTFTLLRTDEGHMEALATAYAEALQNGEAMRQRLTMGEGYDLQKSWQHFGGEVVGSWFYFYDLLEMAEVFGTSEQAEAVQRCLNEAIVDYYAAPSYATDYGGGIHYLSIARYCGLGVSVPELFWLRDRYNPVRSTATSAQMTAAYPLTQWASRLAKVKS